MKQYDHIPDTLLTKIAAYQAKTEKAAKKLCKKCNIPEDAANALKEDIAALLHGKYEGMAATLEQMRALQQMNKKTTDANAELRLITFLYRLIVLQVEGTNTLPLSPFWGITICEACRLQGIDAETYVTETGSAYRLQDAQESAQQLYYSICVQLAGNTPATIEELEAIQPLCHISDNDRETALFLATERITENKKRFRKIGATYNAILAGKGGAIDISKRTAERNTPAPLQKYITERMLQAELLQKDPEATDEERQAAAEMIASRNAVYQFYNSLPIIMEECAPISATEQTITYELSTNELARYETGCKTPNNTQTYVAVSAAKFASQIRYKIEAPKGKNKKGKIVYDTIDYRPVDVKIFGEREEDAATENAKKVHIIIDRSVQTGRAQLFKSESSGTILIENNAYNTFGSTPEGVHFRAILFNVYGEKTGNYRVCEKNEEDLLNAIFDYDGKEMAAKKHAQEARRLSDQYPNNKEIRMFADAAEASAKRIRTAHIDRDYKQLCKMFSTAAAVGLITTYNRVATAEQPKKIKKYGRGYKWTWQKPA